MQTFKNLATKPITLPLAVLLALLGLLLLAALPRRGLAVAELALRAYLHTQRRSCLRLTLLLLVGLGLAGLWLLARGG